MVKLSRGFTIVAILIVAALVIGIGATLGYQKLKTKPSPSPSPASITQSPTPDQTVYTEQSRSANWKTYESTNFRYTFKYPPNWILTDCDGNIAMLGPDVYTRGMCQSGAVPLILVRVENKSAAALIADDKPDYYDNYMESTILIGGVKSVRHSGTWKVQGELDLRGTTFSRNWVPLKSNQTLIITYTQYKSVSNYQEQFDQILSTFKFLE